MTYREGDILYMVKITPEALAQIFTRDERGNRIIVDWGEPDEEGFRNPSFTIDYNQNLVVDELRKFRSAVSLLKQPILGKKGGVSKAEVEGLIDARLEGRPWHPVVHP